MERPVLLRIPWSHYCKKAEWGLSQAGIPYDTVDVGFGGMRQIHRANPEEGTVPVLGTADGRIPGSARILRWADRNRSDGTLPLYPTGQDAAVRRWEDWADAEVGPVSRREAYRVAYNEPGRFAAAFPVRWILRAGRRQILGVVKLYRTRRFDEHDAAAVPEIVAKVSQRLQKTGTGYLFGAYPTAADIATAALMEPFTFAARAHGYPGLDGWQDCADLIDRVRPSKTTRRRRRPMSERHWRRFETLGAEEMERGEEADVSFA